MFEERLARARRDSTPSSANKLGRAQSQKSKPKPKPNPESESESGLKEGGPSVSREFRSTSEPVRVQRVKTSASQGEYVCMYVCTYQST